MAPRVARELPPALQTRQSNKTKVVGGPDMPKPRRSPEEVAQARAVKAAAKEQAENAKKAASQRIADLQAALGEDAPTTTTTTRAASRVTSSTITPVPRPVGRSSASQMPATPEREDDENLEDAEHEELEPRDEAGSPAPGDDDYLPTEDPEGESETSSMDVDDEDDNDNGVRKKRGKERAGGKKRTNTRTKAMGKRKLNDLEEPETLIAPTTSKKSRATVVRAKGNKPSALVANWEDVAQLRERSLSPPTEIPDDVYSQPGTRSSSRLSTASSVPPSTTGDTTDSDGLGLGEGESAIDDDAATYPVPNSAEPRALESTRIRVNDVRDALCYRTQQVELAASTVKPGTGGSATGTAASLALATSASPTLPEITHPLTKVARKVSAPGGDKNPGPKGDVAITATKKKRHRRNAGAEDASGKSKPTINDLPLVMQRPFATRFTPIARQFAGTLEPWADVKFTELQVIHRRAFGDLADLHPLEEDDKCHKLIQCKISDWRAKFALTSMETWKEILVDPDMKEVFTSTEGVGKYAVFLLGDGQAAAPFFWREWNKGEKKIGRLQGELIIGSLASHIAEMVNVPRGERNQEMPRGALGMATLAAMHTLSHYTTGQWKPPAGRAGWFSGDNYSDSVVFVDGHHKSDKKLTRIMKVIDALDANEWLEIVDAARAVMVRRQTAPGKRTKSGQGAVVAADPAADGAESDDSDLMLVADA